jgi:hypothetical protein
MRELRWGDSDDVNEAIERIKVQNPKQAPPEAFIIYGNLEWQTGS